MATEEQSDQEKKNTTLSPEDSQGLDPVESGKPVKAEGIKDETVQELEKRSKDLVNQLQEASGSKELELIDSITSVGIQAQRTAGSDLDLLRTRIGDMLTQGGAGEKISKELIELRLTLNEINPHELTKKSFIWRMLSHLPFFKLIDPGLKTLEKIAIRYEPVCKQVGVIETKLRDGRMILTKDNIELRKLYEQVEEQQFPIKKNAYLGELIIQQLSDVTERTHDPIKKERIQNALHDVSMRVQDLRTMEEVYLQFFISIDMTRQNNTRLGQSVERTLSLATNLVTVGLAIQSALARQKRVLEATQRTREFLGNLIVANAATIKKHTTEIGDVYNQPAIAIEKVTQAHNEVLEAMDIASRLKQEGIDSARENIAKLGQMSTELQARIGGPSDQVVEEPESLEA